MGVGHYENFPVASLLLHGHLRRPIAAIYRFARSADDIADEGDQSPAERLAALGRFSEQLRRIEQGEQPAQPLFAALADVIRAHRLPARYFHDLLDAFAQDCVQTRYASYVDLQAYAKRSADPVGRLLLHLFEAADPAHLANSDKICSALQFINFWQDVAVDYRKNRIYIPLEDMRRFQVSEADLGAGEATAGFRALMGFQVARTRTLLHEGAALGRALQGRIGLEIRMIVAGGDTILQQLIDRDYDVFRHRPRLRPHDWIGMLLRACLGDGRMPARSAS
jgi:squalene synthase HpnC